MCCPCSSSSRCAGSTVSAGARSPKRSGAPPVRTIVSSGGGWEFGHSRNVRGTLRLLRCVRKRALRAHSSERTCRNGDTGTVRRVVLVCAGTSCPHGRACAARSAGAGRVRVPTGSPPGRPRARNGSPHARTTCVVASGAAPTLVCPRFLDGALLPTRVRDWRAGAGREPPPGRQRAACAQGHGPGNTNGAVRAPCSAGRCSHRQAPSR